MHAITHLPLDSLLTNRRNKQVSQFQMHIQSRSVTKLYLAELTERLKFNLMLPLFGILI